jgi:hypothetical protein
VPGGGSQPLLRLPHGYCFVEAGVTRDANVNLKT